MTFACMIMTQDRLGKFLEMPRCGRIAGCRTAPSDQMLPEEYPTASDHSSLSVVFAEHVGVQGTDTSVVPVGGIARAGRSST